RKAVTEKVLEASAKIGTHGVHPHHLTKRHVMKALADGDISTADCLGLLDFLGEADKGDAADFETNDVTAN
ncbi:hypothetical protein GP486_008584, partial [Trichoglossum hirsutum]